MSEDEIPEFDMDPDVNPYEEEELGLKVSDTAISVEENKKDKENANKKQKKQDIVPTSDEIQELKQSQELFKSNLFKLQIQELLKELKVEPEQTRRLDQFLHHIRHTINTMPEQSTLSWPSGHLALGVPLHREMEGGAKFSMTFHRPTEMYVVGSYLLHSMARPVLNVDLAVQIPKACLMEKDYLNYRYLDKRALYLEAIAKHLAKHSELADITVEGFRGEPLKPILNVRPPADWVPGQASQQSDDKEQKSKSKKRKADDEKEDSKQAAPRGLLPKFVVRIVPCLAGDAFVARKLGPNRNCTAAKEQNQKDAKKSKSSDAVSSSEAVVTPTPYYNQLVLEDMYLYEHLQQLHAIYADQPHIVEATLLFKTWARQRGLLSAPSAPSPANTISHCPTFSSSSSSAFATLHSLPQSELVPGFVFSMLLLHLQRTGAINASMSCYQVFRMALQYLVDEKNDWSKTGLMMASEQHSSQTSEQKEQTAALLASFLRSFDVVFLDASGTINLTARMTRSVYEELVQEATLTLAQLEDSRSNGFENVFLTPIQRAVKYDLFFTLPFVPSKYPNKIYPRLPSLPPLLAFSRAVHTLLTRAWGNRVTSISVRPTVALDNAQGGSKKKSSVALKQGLSVAVTLNPLHYDRVLDMGPPAGNDEATQAVAKEYQDFWGSKSELRRFKDGRIVEAVLWNVPSSSPHMVLAMIARHILNRHLSVPESEVTFVGSQFDAVLRYRHVQDKSLDDPMHATSKLQAAYKTLTDRLKELPHSDLPLRINTIQSAHAALRLTSAFPPQPVKMGEVQPDTLRDSMEAVPVVLEFEHSSSWPDDLAAICRIKSAFYCRIAQALERHYSMQAVVGLDFVDVLMNGFAFRVRIFNHREILLRRAHDMDTSEDKPVLPPFARYDLMDLERAMIYAPRLAGHLAGFRQRHPPFSLMARLAKRWLACHMLSECLSEEAVDLLVAYTILQSQPYSAPTSGFSGFLRFLRLLSEFPFTDRPVVVDVAGDMKDELYSAIIDRFEANRIKKIGAPLYIATEQDPESKLWTTGTTEAALQRVATYARSSFAALIALINKASAPHSSTPAAAFLSLFKTPLSQFSALISLSPSSLPSHIVQRALTKLPSEQAASEQEQKKKSKYKLPPTSADLSPPVHAPLIGLDPTALLVAELRREFADVAEFYYDALAGAVVAVQWKASATTPKKFNVAHAAYTQPTEPNGTNPTTITVNTADALYHMRLLGKGLIRDIFTSEQQYLASLQ